MFPAAVIFQILFIITILPFGIHFLLILLKTKISWTFVNHFFSRNFDKSMRGSFCILFVFHLSYFFFNTFLLECVSVFPIFFHFLDSSFGLFSNWFLGSPMDFIHFSCGITFLNWSRVIYEKVRVLQSTHKNPDLSLSTQQTSR